MLSKNGFEYALDDSIFERVERDPLDEIVTKRNKVLVLAFEPVQH